MSRDSSILSKLSATEMVLVVVVLVVVVLVVVVLVVVVLVVFLWLIVQLHYGYAPT